MLVDQKTLSVIQAENAHVKQVTRVKSVNQTPVFLSITLLEISALVSFFVLIYRKTAIKSPGFYCMNSFLKRTSNRGRRQFKVGFYCNNADF